MYHDIFMKNVNITTENWNVVSYDVLTGYVYYICIPCCLSYMANLLQTNILQQISPFVFTQCVTLTSQELKTCTKWSAMFENLILDFNIM